ncbi:hypothetical protein [Modestobacter sp. NPDC049651]|uniref:hypothetical protein n=1 Tax=unclassified Modestobacter TaxID=2643866 RepID=UPI0033E1BDEB
MTTAQPVGPTVPVPPVRASALAAWQLVEDARYRTPEWRTHRERTRARALRAVADRKFERSLDV